MYLGDFGIYIDGSSPSIADAIVDVENGRRNMNLVGENLRAKALAELDYRKIAEELSGEYARIGNSALLQIQAKTVA